MTKKTKPLLGLGILLSGLLLACQDKPVAVQSERACYAYTKNRDTVQLSLNQQGEQLSGDLVYSLFEKDKNTGKVTGKMLGDTLLLDYTFGSEGRQSERQVAFLKKGDQLTEGYAEVEEHNGTVKFKRRADLKFGGIIVLNKTACKEN